MGESITRKTTKLGYVQGCARDGAMGSLEFTVDIMLSLTIWVSLG